MQEAIHVLFVERSVLNVCQSVQRFSSLSLTFRQLLSIAFVTKIAASHLAFFLQDLVTFGRQAEQRVQS